MATRRKLKKRKSDVKEKTECQGDDRISELPDPILQHILSFLPTKTCVGTCSLLSSRWKNLWTHLPVLEFECSQLFFYFGDHSPLDEANFKKFVDRVLLLHDTPSLRKFRLKIRSIDIDRNQVNSWISTVIKPRKIEEIDIEVHHRLHTNLTLPCDLFTCESLTSLKVSSTLYTDQIIPRSMHFSNLKFLHLDGITFRGDGSTQQGRISFSTLEQLTITNCLVDIDNIELYVPLLKRFTCREVDASDDCYGIVNVYATSLMSLTIDDKLSCTFHIHNASSLVDASVNVYEVDSSDDSVSELLRGITNVNNMVLSLDVIEAVFSINNSAQLPIFPYLITLKLYYLDSGLTYGVIMLLDKCPNLESLFIKADSIACGNDECTLAMAPQCFLSHLKSIELEDVHGTENELSMVKFFLKNTSLLQKMVIVSSKDLSKDSRKKRRFSRQLLMLSRSSTCCKIDFS